MLLGKVRLVSICLICLETLAVPTAKTLEKNSFRVRSHKAFNFTSTTENEVRAVSISKQKPRSIELYLNPYDPLSRVAAKIWNHLFPPKWEKPSTLPPSIIHQPTTSTKHSTTTKRAEVEVTTSKPVVSTTKATTTTKISETTTNKILLTSPSSMQSTSGTTEAIIISSSPKIEEISGPSFSTVTKEPISHESMTTTTTQTFIPSTVLSPVVAGVSSVSNTSMENSSINWTMTERTTQTPVLPDSSDTTNISTTTGSLTTANQVGIDSMGNSIVNVATTEPSPNSAETLTTNAFESSISTSTVIVESNGTAKPEVPFIPTHPSTVITETPQDSSTSFTSILTTESSDKIEDVAHTPVTHEPIILHSPTPQNGFSLPTTTIKVDDVTSQSNSGITQTDVINSTPTSNQTTEEEMNQPMISVSVGPIHGNGVLTESTTSNSVGESGIAAVTVMSNASMQTKPPGQLVNASTTVPSITDNPESVSVVIIPLPTLPPKNDTLQQNNTGLNSTSQGQGPNKPVVSEIPASVVPQYPENASNMPPPSYPGHKPPLNPGNGSTLPNHNGTDLPAQNQSSFTPAQSQPQQTTDSSSQSRPQPIGSIPQGNTDVPPMGLYPPNGNGNQQSLKPIGSQSQNPNQQQTVHPNPNPPGPLIPPNQRPPFPPGAQHQGQNPSSSFPPGSQPQGQNPSGSYPPGSQSQGQNPPYLPGSQPQGQNPAGTYPPGSQPQGQNPAGPYPPGSQSQGQNPAGPYPPGSQPQGQNPAGPYPPGSQSQGQNPAGPYPPGSQSQGQNPAGPYPPGSQPQGQNPPYPPGSLPQGQNPTGPYPPGSQPQGQHPPYPPGSQPQGQKPQGSFPPGSQPQGQNPPGPYPSGSQPQGQNPSGTYPPGSQPQGQNPPGPYPPGSQPQAQKPPAPFPPGSQPQGQKPPSSFPPGSQPQGQNPPGPYPPGSQPPAQKPPVPFPPGSQPQGQNPSGAYPPGSNPQGQKPPVPFPPGSQPQGQNPSGVYPPGSQPQGQKPSGLFPPGSQPQGQNPSGSFPSGPQQQGQNPSVPYPPGSQPQGQNPSGSFPSGPQQQGQNPSVPYPPGSQPQGQNTPGQYPPGSHPQGQHQLPPFGPRPQGIKMPEELNPKRHQLQSPNQKPPQQSHLPNQTLEILSDSAPSYQTYTEKLSSFSLVNHGLNKSDQELKPPPQGIYLFEKMQANSSGPNNLIRQNQKVANHPIVLNVPQPLNDNISDHSLFLSEEQKKKLSNLHRVYAAVHGVGAIKLHPIRLNASLHLTK